MSAEARRKRADIAADDAAFDALLERAARVPQRPAQPSRGAPGSRRWVQVAAAAALVLATGLWLGLRPGAPLPEAVVSHIEHEPKSLVRTSVPVADARFDEVLQQAGAELKRPVGLVTYVNLCPFRGRKVAHFVVQGEKGPVTVLLLPDENVVSKTPFSEDGFVGTLVPLKTGGSIAVVGEPDESLDAIAERVADAVRWKV